MLRILKDTAEFQTAIQSLEAQGLTPHKTPAKNWDLELVRSFFADLDKDAPVLDLGAAGGVILNLLHDSGHTNLRGVDLVAEPSTFKMKLKKMFVPSTFLARDFTDEGDITATPYEDNQFAAATCISVLEHDVDLPKFFAECGRIIRPGGKLLATFDYWEDFDNEADGPKAVCGLPWYIFNRQTVGEMLELAKSNGFVPADGETDIPPCGETVVEYANRHYTFMAVGLVKQG